MRLVTVHNIAWMQTSFLATTTSRHHLDLAEHAAIQVRKPMLNLQQVGPTCNFLWNPFIPRLSKSMKS